MQHKFDPAQVQRLLSSEREETLDPQRVLSMVPIRHFHTVADVGCGPGYFLIPLAKYLRDGKAIGLDVQPEMLAMAKARVEEARLANTELIQTAADAELSLDPQSVDGALLSCVLHENQDRVALLRAVAEALRPGGWCAILEWQKRETGTGPPLEVRLDPEQVKEDAAEAQLTFKEVRELGERYYLLLLRR